MDHPAPLPKDPSVTVASCTDPEQQRKVKEDERRKKQQKLCARERREETDSDDDDLESEDTLIGIHSFM